MTWSSFRRIVHVVSTEHSVSSSVGKIQGSSSRRRAVEGLSSNGLNRPVDVLVVVEDG